MAPAVPILSGAEVVRAFERHGWRVARQRGSHIIMTKPGFRSTLSVPDHDEVARGTLRGLVRAAELTLDEFLTALD